VPAKFVQHKILLGLMKDVSSWRVIQKVHLQGNTQGLKRVSYHFGKRCAFEPKKGA